jgi:hypothetical protein
MLISFYESVMNSTSTQIVQIYMILGGDTSLLDFCWNSILQDHQSNESMRSHPLFPSPLGDRISSVVYCSYS